MRSAQVYRWQIPMDAGVVLRDRRLKLATGCMFVCVTASVKGGERSPLPGFSQENVGGGADGATNMGERLASGERGITGDAFGRVWRKLRAGGILFGVC